MQNSLISTTDLTTLLQSNHLVCSASVTFTLKDSTQYTITADNIIKYGIQTDLMESNKISLGSCVPSVGDIEVISSAITFNTKQVAYYTIYYSILMPNNVTQAVPLGTFYPDNISVNGLTTVFKGYDILKKFDKVFKESQVNRATVTSLYTRFTQACTICGISSPTITVDDNPDGDASYIFNTLTGYCMPQQDFDTYRSYVGCIAAACGCSVAAGREPNTLRLVSIFRQSDSNVDYTFSDSFVSISESWARSVLFTEIRFRNYSKLATGTRIDDYDIESLVADDSIEKMYKYGKNPFIEPQAMWDELDGRRCYIRARNRIRSQFGNSYEFFNLEIAPIPAFDTGDTLKILGADGSWHWIYISGWTFDGLTLTLNFGDPGSGASATSTGGAGLGYATAGGQTSQALNTLEDETDLSDVDVVKDLDSYLYHINVLKNPEEAGTVLSKISAEHIHADNILDLSSPQTTEYVYSFDFPAVIQTSAQWDGSSVGGYRFNPHMTDIAIPCKVHCELTTDAKLVGMVDSCSRYFCPEIVTNGAGLTSYIHASNHVHGVQLAVDFKLYDENKHVYTLGNCSNVSVTFDETSQIRCSGYGGADMGACADITDGDHTVPTGATNYSLEDMGISIDDYAKHRLDWSKSVVAYCLYNYKQFGDIEEITPTETLYKSKHVPDSIPSGNIPDYLTLCDANTQYLSNYTLTESDIDENNNWVIPANHCEYHGTTYHSTDDGRVFVPAYIHIIQPTLTVDLDYAANNYSKIKIDLGWIPKDEGWFDRHWDTTYPRWDNYIAKWSIAPYADGYHDDIYNNSKNGHFENEAVQGVISGKLMRLRKETRIPFYLFQYNYAGIKLYDNNDLFEADYNAASAMLNGDTTYYTNALAVTDGTFLVGEYNTSVETLNMLLQAIIGSGNTLSNAKANADVVIIGESNYVNNQGLSGVLIGSGNAVNLNGLAVMENNYGFAFIPETDDIYMFLGREEMYSIRELINRIYSGGVTFEISEDGTVITITNEGTGDYVNILQKTYSLSFDVSGSDALVITLTSDTGDSSSISIPYNDITTGVFNTTYGSNVITRISNLESRMTTAEGDIDTLESSVSGLSTRMTTAEGEIDTLQSDVSGLDTRVTTAEGDIDTLETNVSGLTTRVGTAEGEIDTLQTDLGALTTRVGTAEGDIDSLESSVSGLSTRMTTAEGDIDTLEGNVSSLSTRMTSAEGDIDTLESSVSGLSTRMTTAEGEIDTLESGLSGLTTRVTTAEGEIDTLQSDLTNLTTRVGTAEGDIDTLESDKMDKVNPTGTGALSLNRLADTDVGTNSVALGTDATASGTNSLAGGRQTVASGANSLAYGNTATASAGGTIALGNSANASIVSAVALGFRATASGKYSVALSGGTTSGEYTLAMGRDTEAHYDYSIALGRGLITTYKHQVVIGKYNATNNYASFVIGDGGSSESRWNTMWVEGNYMYIQATNSRSPLSVVNVEYLQDNYKLADISTLEAELVEIYNSTAAYTNAAD